MARGPVPNSAGSQFFVVHCEHATSLDGQYTAFGEIDEAGLDVLDAIDGVDCEFGSGGERSVPVERIEIQSMTVEVLPEVQPAAETPAKTDESVSPPEAEA